jgi:tRNA-splicing ligase RtcB
MSPTQNPTRRADPLEIAAREMCLAAGTDPDSRVAKPGNPRGMPAWCNFRDAASAERNASEAEELAAQIVNLRPQEERFQNSPLTIFGDHDQITIAQMRNCMAIGNAVKGVICADGHLGYAQPVGGVIAYEGQISISGVGFDIGCGNMAVRLDTPFIDIEDRVAPILAGVRKVISFGVGRVNEERVAHELFDDADAWRESDMLEYRQKAASRMNCSTTPMRGGNPTC